MSSTSSSPADKPIGLAIIGAGLMGRQHMMSAIHEPMVSIRGVFAANAGQAKSLAHDADVAQIPTIDDVFDDPEIEAVLIATPTDTHVPVALDAIAADRHVFVEKPVSRYIDDALQLQAAAKRNDKVVGVGHVIRYFPEYRELAAAVEAGEVGNPAIATFGRRCQKPDWAPDGWHTSMQRSGGVAIDMLIHDVDLVRWYFGEPDSVYARVVESNRFDGIDYALATLTVPDGPICHLHGSWGEPSGFSQMAEICGSGGMLSYDSRGRSDYSLVAHDAQSAVTALPPPPPGEHDPFRRQLRAFARDIRGIEPMPGNIDWAVGSLRIALAMVESSRTGETIDLSDAKQATTAGASS